MAPPLHHLRAGVIGTGFIGPVHIEALKRLGVQVTAICGSTQRRAGDRGASGAFRRCTATTTTRRCLASPNVDVVHITSPNKVHVEQSLAALAAGKHVVCEKPLGMTAEETAQGRAAAAKKKLAGLRRELHVPLLPRRAPDARDGAARRPRADHPRAGPLLPGLAAAGDRLQLAPARQRRRQAARRRRHRHALDRRRVLHPRREGRERLRAHSRPFTRRGCARRAKCRPSRRSIRRRWFPTRWTPRTSAACCCSFGKSKHGFADGVHANAAISQVAAGWKCSLSIGIYGTKGSVQWELAAAERNPRRPARRAESDSPARARRASTRMSRASPTIPAATPRASPTPQDALPRRL